MRLAPNQGSRAFRFSALALGLVVTTTTACVDEATDDSGFDTDVQGVIEVLGLWADEYGGHTRVTPTSWDTATIVTYDNRANSAVLQNAADDVWNPSKFSKVVWTERAAGEFWFCTVDFGLETALAASATTKTADASSPSTGGCGGFAWTRFFVPFELEGLWATNFIYQDDVSSILWNAQAIVSFSNQENVAITQNPPDDPWGPSLFSKLVWTEPVAGEFYYCFVDFGRATADEAAASENVADASDPETSGCGPFSWTRAFPAIELNGNWVSDFGTEVIDSFVWDAGFMKLDVVAYDNGTNTAITQNPADDAWNPSKFNKVVWTEPTDGAFYYCIVAFGLDSDAAAWASEASADATDPATGGCGGFPWTRLASE